MKDPGTRFHCETSQPSKFTAIEFQDCTRKDDLGVLVVPGTVRPGLDRIDQHGHGQKKTEYNHLIFYHVRCFLSQFQFSNIHDVNQPIQRHIVTAQV